MFLFAVTPIFMVGGYEKIDLEAVDREMDDLVAGGRETQDDDSHGEVQEWSTGVSEYIGESLVSNRVDLSGVTVGQSNGSSRESHEDGTPFWQDEHPQMKSQIDVDEHQDNEETGTTENPSGETGSRSSIIQVKLSAEPLSPSTGPVIRKNTSKQNVTTTSELTRAEKMKLMREKVMTKKLGRKEDMFKPVMGEVVVEEVTRRALTRRGQRKLLARDVQNRLVQDRSIPMVIVGSDVESLYPSLDADQVAEIVRDAVMRSRITFDGVHYQEGARYIVLNSSEKECRSGPLKRILPRRRFVNGTRPGVTGAGPMGAESGDQIQWKFRNVELTDLEKRLIIAKVMMISVKMLFTSHVYSFAGKQFLQ
jgi:hypothetical protein